MRGVVDTTMPFPELRSQSYINERGRTTGRAADFSQQIREGLPPRPPPDEDRQRLNGDVVGLIQKSGLDRESLLAQLREQIASLEPRDR